MNISKSQRFTPDSPCPACGHAGWCFKTISGRSFWCGRVETFNGRVGETREGKDGWKHFFKPLAQARADGEVGSSPAPAPARRRQPPPVDPAVFADIDQRARRRVTAEQVRGLADLLGVNVASLRRLGIGWLDAAEDFHVDRETGFKRWTRILPGTNTRCAGPGAFTFPVYDGHWRIRGVRLRTLPTARDPEGFKYVVDGTDGSALHLPRGLIDARGGDLLVPEGGSSLAALLTLGLHGMGRPNCSAGSDYLRRAIAALRPARVFIIGDRDKPDGRGVRAGEKWAPIVADRVRGAWPGLHACVAVLPPPDVKDSRVWLAEGCTRAELQGHLDAAVAHLDRGWRHAG